MECRVLWCKLKRWSGAFSDLKEDVVKVGGHIGSRHTGLLEVYGMTWQPGMVWKARAWFLAWSMTRRRHLGLGGVGDVLARHDQLGAMAWCDVLWHGMAWHGMLWHGYAMLWLHLRVIHELLVAEERGGVEGLLGDLGDVALGVYHAHQPSQGLRVALQGVSLVCYGIAYCGTWPTCSMLNWDMSMCREILLA